jgi:hypothetical protein
MVDRSIGEKFLQAAWPEIQHDLMQEPACRMAGQSHDDKLESLLDSKLRANHLLNWFQAGACCSKTCTVIKI